MTTSEVNIPSITDFITGKVVPNVGAEENRQQVERFLVKTSGFAKGDVRINVPLCVTVQNEPYAGRVDVTISAKGRTVAVIKCVAGSPGSWLREMVAAARLLEETPIPWAVVSDGEVAVVMDLINGQTAEGLIRDVFSLEKAMRLVDQPLLPKLTDKQRQKESILFRSYNMDQVNVIR